MKPMLLDGFFSGRSIARQLALLRNILIGGLLLAGLGYLAAVNTQQMFIRANTEIALYQFQTYEFSKHLMEARRYEKDFLLYNDPNVMAGHKKALSDLFEHIEYAITAAPDAQSKDLVVQVRDAMREYDGLFKKVMSSRIALGLDENGGLRGVMRDAVHEVESAVNATGLEPLMVSMLMMRRYEKNFLQRLDAKKYSGAMAVQKSRFDRLLARSKLSPAKKAQVATDMGHYQTAFHNVVKGAVQVAADVKAMRKVAQTVEPIAVRLQEESTQRLEASNARSKAAIYTLNGVYGIALAVISAIILGGVYVVSRTISNPLSRLTETVKRLAAGDDEARAQIVSKNEFGQLGGAFDQMMDERLATQRAIQRENEQLNDSVLRLLQAVAQLAKRDLTIKVPVTEDVTGPVADALNLLTSETGKVLADVSNISADVTAASLKVKEQTDTVKEVAKVGRHEVELTAESLASAARAMNQIAELAQVCNLSADSAIVTTKQALKAVGDTVGGINNTRDTIRETEKRIKRLGERSQEISGAVNLINTIAERTHILALNASMHAASAGEAGRGFAVVADEVQRLAENARQATAQIASLVNNIQVETIDTVNTMNAAITRVVEGAKLAEHASERMNKSEETTSELVSLVQRIATDSSEQAKISNELLSRSAQIRKSTEETAEKIAEAERYTDNLVEYAKNLLGAVRVFKLPS